MHKAVSSSHVFTEHKGGEEEAEPAMGQRPRKRAHHSCPWGDLDNGQRTSHRDLLQVERIEALRAQSIWVLPCPCCESKEGSRRAFGKALRGAGRFPACGRERDVEAQGHLSARSEGGSGWKAGEKSSWRKPQGTRKGIWSGLGLSKEKRLNYYRANGSPPKWLREEALIGPERQDLEYHLSPQRSGTLQPHRPSQSTSPRAYSTGAEERTEAVA